MSRTVARIALVACLVGVLIASWSVRGDADAQSVTPTPAWQAGNGSVGNRVWVDLNGDGIQDRSEPGQPGVAIDLYSDTNELLATGSSGPGGWWGYPNLTTGRCYVVAVRLVSGQQHSPTSVGADRTRDSDFGLDGRTRVCLTADRPTRTDIDAGLTVPADTPPPANSSPFWHRGSAQFGNRVWHDINRDGIQSPGEPGLEGIPIIIDALANGSSDDIAGRTGPGGWYGMTGLTAGCYVLKVELNNWRVTPEFRGSDPTRDSDLVRDLRAGFAGYGASNSICLADGQTDDSIDIGLHAIEPLPEPGLDRFVPLTGATSVAAGYSTTCATVADGRVRCWGMNNAGEAGHDPNEFTEVTHAVQVDSVVATNVSAGANGMCAARPDGDVSCWGIDVGWGIRWVPPVALGTDGATRSTGGTYSGCSLRSDRTARCWGFSWLGQLGDGLPATAGEGSWRYPVAVAALNDAVEISRFSDHGCARRADDTVVCWGSNSSGQLGSAGDRTGTPRPVTGLSQVRDLATTNETTCAAKTDGSVWCWGSSAGGVAPTSGPDPRQVNGLERIVSVEIGPESACALREDGTVWCWGNGVADGQRGNGTITGGGPTRVLLDEAATAITVGGAHACAITVTTSVHCWGDNRYGQLGDATGQDRLTPSTVVRIP